MGPAYQFEIVFMHKVVGDFGSEQPSRAPGTDGPVFNLLRIRPDEIAECA